MIHQVFEGDEGESELDVGVAGEAGTLVGEEGALVGVVGAVGGGAVQVPTIQAPQVKGQVEQTPPTTHVLRDARCVSQNCHVGTGQRSK